MRSRKLVLGLALAACDGGAFAHDAALRDGGIDASADAEQASIDADEATRVDVTSYTFDGDGAVDPTAIAIFSDPSGNVVQHGPVDAQGRVHAYMALGGTVTVLQAKTDAKNVFQRYDRVTTIRGVEPGDQLITGRTKNQVIRTGTYDTMYASYTPLNGAGPYLLTACATTGNTYPVPLYFYPSCATTTFDLLALADDPNTNVRHYVWLDDVAHVPNGNVTLPNTWTAMPTSTTTFLHSPANMLVGAALYAVLDGIPFGLDQKQLTAPPATSSVSLLYAPITGPIQVVATYGQGIGVFERFVVVTTGSTANVTVDWDTLPVPRATNVQQSTTGVTWTQAASGSGDARVVTWASQWTDGNNVTHYASWETLEPVQGPNQTNVLRLPDDYAEDDPTRNSGTLRGASVWYFDYENLADYHAAKLLGTELLAIEQRFLTTVHRAHVSIGATN